MSRWLLGKGTGHSLLAHLSSGLVTQTINLHSHFLVSPFSIPLTMPVSLPAQSSSIVTRCSFVTHLVLLRNILWLSASPDNITVAYTHFCT